MCNFKIILILSFFVLAVQVSFAQTTTVYKSKDKITGKVNVLTVTENADKSILVKRSTEEAAEDSRIVAYNIAVLNSTMNYFWIIPFKEGIAERAGGSVTVDCHCKQAGEESVSDACKETFTIQTGQVHCSGNNCRNCEMTITTENRIYNNTGGYLIIEATKVTIE